MVVQVSMFYTPWFQTSRAALMLRVASYSVLYVYKREGKKVDKRQRYANLFRRSYLFSRCVEVKRGKGNLRKRKSTIK